MTGGQRAELERLARSHTAPAREVRQAKALLWATDGVAYAEIARRCASTLKSVRRGRGSPRPSGWEFSASPPFSSTAALAPRSVMAALGQRGERWGCHSAILNTAQPTVLSTDVRVRGGRAAPQ